MRKSSISLNRNEDSDGSNEKTNSEDEVSKTSTSNGRQQFKYLDKLEGLIQKNDSDDEDSKSKNSKNTKSVGKKLEKPRALSDDDSESDHHEFSKKKIEIPNEYNPNLYENLQVDDEIKELFQYIVKYMPQQLTLDYKFKPFIPDFLPAVGDIDAFLKVQQPETSLCGENFNFHDQHLGFAILDEPATIQSDSALLHLQLRATNIGAPQNAEDVIVKKIENIDKNHKIIDKWIKDISDLHKSKSSPIVNYGEPMPDIDDLMQEWSEEMENRLKEHGFPTPEPNMKLKEYMELVCDIFQIPIGKNKIHSLHLLFSLYESVKQSNFFQSNPQKENNEKENEENDRLLVLD